jgi:hypothetical protein
VLSPAHRIVVIAPDLGLRQALTFALEVEGYLVESHALWSSDDVMATPSTCLIIDEQILRGCTDARGYLNDPRHTVILLTDGMSTPIDDKQGLTLAKPFDGADLLQLVRTVGIAA